MQDVVSSSSASSSLPTFSIPLSCPPRIIHESSSSSMISLLSTSSHVSSMSSSYPYHYQPTPTQPMSHHHTWQSPSPQSSHHHTSSPSPSPIKPTRHPWLMDLPSRTSPKPTSSSHTHTHTHTHSTHVSHSQSPSLSSSTSHRTLDIPSSATSHSDMLSSSHSIPVPSHLMSMSPPLPPPRAHIPLPSDYFDTCARRGPLYIATHDTQPHQHIHVDHHPHLWNFLHTQILLKVPQKSEEEKALEATIDEYATWTVPLPPRKKINKTTHSASTSTSTSTSSDPSNASSTPKSTTSKRKSTSTPHYSFVCDCGNLSMCKCICTIQPTASAITYQSSDSIKRFKVEETGMMDANELMALAMKIAMNGDE